MSRQSVDLQPKKINNKHFVLPNPFNGEINKWGEDPERF